VQAIDAVVATEGPFYGILGYSQGTAMSIAYLAHAPNGTFQISMQFAAYIPTTHQGLVARIDAAAPLTLPTFLWMGGCDIIITNDKTDGYATKFPNVTRSGSCTAGHVVPKPSDGGYNDILAFVTAMNVSTTVHQTIASHTCTSTPGTFECVMRMFGVYIGIAAACLCCCYGGCFAIYWYCCRKPASVAPPEFAEMGPDMVAVPLGPPPMGSPEAVQPKNHAKDLE